MEVLGNGYIELVDSMGDDLRIVNAARKSFNRESDEWSKKNADLLKYLWDNKHTSPFEMVEFTFEVKAPLFVVRQWQRHRTWSYNEVSRRYTSDNLDFYIEEVWRLQDTDNKQASYGAYEGPVDFTAKSRKHMENALDLYYQMLSEGVCREQAREHLPQNMMVEMVAKVDLHNLIHFLRLRLHPHAQWEIQEYARAIVKLVEPVVPETMKLLHQEMENTNGAD